MGGACIPWMFAWPFLIYDRPKQHPYIREKELKYITEALGKVDEKVMSVSNEERNIHTRCDKKYGESCSRATSNGGAENFNAKLDRYTVSNSM